jgi:hypothetical protein
MLLDAEEKVVVVQTAPRLLQKKNEKDNMNQKEIAKRQEGNEEECRHRN